MPAWRLKLSREFANFLDSSGMIVMRAMRRVQAENIYACFKRDRMTASESVEGPRVATILVARIEKCFGESSTLRYDSESSQQKGKFTYKLNYALIPGDCPRDYSRFH